MSNTRQSSDYLRGDQVEDIAGAFGHSVVIGTPLNHFFTVLFAERHAHLTPQACTGRLIKNYGAFAKNNCFEKAFVYGLENGPERGIHAHMGFHVPRGLGRKFGRAMKRWTRDLVTNYVAQGEGNITCKAKRLETNNRYFDRPLRNQASEIISTREYYEGHIDLKGELLYFIKGVNPDSDLVELIQEHSLTGKRWTDRKTNLPNPWKPHYQGSIEGARCRVSNNIGRTARARYGNQVIYLPSQKRLSVAA